MTQFEIERTPSRNEMLIIGYQRLQRFPRFSFTGCKGLLQELFINS